MKHIIILIDFDGVFNSERKCQKDLPRTATHWFGDWHIFDMKRADFPVFFEDLFHLIDVLNISVPQELLDQLTMLDSLDNVEFQWLTTWEKDIKSLVCERINFKAGLDWKVNTFESVQGTEDSRWWKHIIVERICLENPDSQVFFIDDELLDEPNDNDSETLIESHANLTNFACNGTTGLTHADISSISHQIINEKFFNVTIEAL